LTRKNGFSITNLDQNPNRWVIGLFTGLACPDLIDTVQTACTSKKQTRRKITCQIRSSNFESTSNPTIITSLSSQPSRTPKISPTNVTRQDKPTNLPPFSLLSKSQNTHKDNGFLSPSVQTFHSILLPTSPNPITPTHALSRFTLSSTTTKHQIPKSPQIFNPSSHPFHHPFPFLPFFYSPEDPPFLQVCQPEYPFF
jgi:hypothetical protein